MLSHRVERDAALRQFHHQLVAARRRRQRNGGRHDQVEPGAVAGDLRRRADAAQRQIAVLHADRRLALDRHRLRTPRDRDRASPRPPRAGCGLRRARPPARASSSRRRCGPACAASSGRSRRRPSTSSSPFTYSPRMAPTSRTLVRPREAWNFTSATPRRSASPRNSSVTARRAGTRRRSSALRRRGVSSGRLILTVISSSEGSSVRLGGGGAGLRDRLVDAGHHPVQLDLDVVAIFADEREHAAEFWEGQAGDAGVDGLLRLTIDASAGVFALDLGPDVREEPAEREPFLARLRRRGSHLIDAHPEHQEDADQQ